MKPKRETRTSALPSQTDAKSSYNGFTVLRIDQVELKPQSRRQVSIHPLGYRGAERVGQHNVKWRMKRSRLVAHDLQAHSAQIPDNREV
jgi:hypothetical protein